MNIDTLPKFYQPTDWLVVILRHVKDALITTDCNAIVTFMNPAAEQLTGFTQAESIGQNLSQVYQTVNTQAKLDSSALRGYLDWSAQVGGQVESGSDISLKPKSGDRIQIEQTVSLLESEQGIKSGYVLIFRHVIDRATNHLPNRPKEQSIEQAEIGSIDRDLATQVRELKSKLEDVSQKLCHETEVRLTVEQQLKESRERYCQLFNCAADSIFVHEFAEDGKPSPFTEVNDAACSILGYTREELLKLGVRDIVPPPKICDDVMLKKFADEKRRLFEIDHIAKDGSRHPVEVRVNIFEINGKRIGMGIARDITDRRLAEAEQQKAFEKQKELAELRSQFISTISHEFRTPLSSIQLTVELLEDQLADVSPEVKAKRFKRIKCGINRMTQLLEDVLLIGKIEAGKQEFNPKPLDLESFCDEIVEEMQSIAGNKQRINFATKTQGVKLRKVQMDEKLVRHILSNLLSNAIKYSKPDTKVQFDLCYVISNSLESKPHIVFRIQDRGIGIPPQDQPKLFESFHRAKNVSLIPGTGLGLAITKNCVTLHGGEISVESTVDVGTTFTVTIPVECA